MSNNAILAALRRMGYDKDEMTGHGFRAIARTRASQVLNIWEKKSKKKTLKEYRAG